MKPDRLTSNDFQVNSTNSDYRFSPTIVALPDGGILLAWTSDGQDGDGFGIFARRFDAEGMPLGDEFQVNTTAAGSQNDPVATALSDGGFVIAWDSFDGDDTDIFAQRFDASGSPVGSEFQVNATPSGSQLVNDIANLGDGGFVITWVDIETVDFPFDIIRWEVAAQRFDAQGNPVGSEFQVNTTIEDIQNSPVVTGLNDGGFVIVWTSEGQDGDESGIFARRYDSSGFPISGEWQVNTTTTGGQGVPDIALLDDGGIVIVWVSADQDLGGVFAQRYDASLSPVGGEFQVNTAFAGLQTRPAVSALPDGGFIVAWESDNLAFNLQAGPPFDASDVVAQRFDANGTPVGMEFLVNTTTEGYQADVVATELANGGFAVGWLSEVGVPPDPRKIFARIFRDLDAVPDMVPAFANSPTVVDVFANDLHMEGTTIIISEVGTASSGSVTISPDMGWLTYTPAPGFVGPDTFTYTITNGNGSSDTATVDVMVFPELIPDQSPMITSNGGGDTGFASVNEGTKWVTNVEASDPNGDPLSFDILGGPDAASFTIDPATGALSFIDAPDYEAHADTDFNNVFELFVGAFDGVHMDVQHLSVTLENISVTPRLIAPDAFGGAYGGEGTIFLTTGHQDISIIERPGTISLVGPAGGDDIIRFDGTAGDYLVARSGSRVLISHADTAVSIPISPIGINLVFADGIRTLGIDGGMIMLGSQVVGTEAAAITAPAEEIVLPELVDPAVAGLLVVSEGIVPTIGDGRFDVFGTSFDVERLEVLSGTVALRTGFNGGLDGVDFPDVSTSYTVQRSGSTVLVEGPDTHLTVPISPAGVTLGFPEGSQHLMLDTGAGMIMLGDLEVTTTPQQISNDLQFLSIDQGANGAPVTIDVWGFPFFLEDDLDLETNVILTRFSHDDVIRVLGGEPGDFIFARGDGDGDSFEDDLIITREGSTDTIVITNVLAADAVVTDLLSAQLATGLQIMAFA